MYVARTKSPQRRLKGRNQYRTLDLLGAGGYGPERGGERRGARVQGFRV